MRKTSERQFPDEIASLEDAVQMARHSYPYRLLATLVDREAQVLEVGFGEGYGSDILAGAVGGYTGVEVAAEAVDHAASAYGDGARSFHLYDGETLPFAAESFDAVFSFQVLEHVDDPDRFLAEMARVSRAGAPVLVTTPNRLVRLGAGERPWNRYHVQEYTAGQLRAMAASLFAEVDVYGVVGTELAERVERARIARLRSLARIDRLGLRYVVPPATAARILRLLRPLRGSGGRDAPTTLPSGDDLAWTHEAGRTEDAVDLLVLARR